MFCRSIHLARVYVLQCSKSKIIFEPSTIEFWNPTLRHCTPTVPANLLFVIPWPKIAKRVSKGGKKTETFKIWSGTVVWPLEPVLRYKHYIGYYAYLMYRMVVLPLKPITNLCPKICNLMNKLYTCNYHLENSRPSNVNFYLPIKKTSE